MNSRSMGQWQLESVIFCYVMGSTVMNFGSRAEQDMWLSMLIAALFCVPLCVVMGRLIKIYPGKNLFEMCDLALGRAAGGAVGFLMLWYALHTAAMVLRELSEFAKITSMHQTPMIVLMGTAIALVIYLAKSGGEVLGRFAVLSLPAVLLVFVGSFALSIDNMDPSQLKPVLDHDLPVLVDSAWGFFANPLAEVVLLLGLGGMMKKNVKPYRMLAVGLGLSVFCILVNWTRAIMIIGPKYMEDVLFAQYIATRTIDIGEVITRIEGITSITYHLVSVIKVTVCALVGAFGLAHLLRFENKNLAVAPSALLVLALSSALYNNVLEVVSFLGIWRYYSLPFQVLLPTLVWIAAELRSRRGPKPKPKPASDGSSQQAN